MQKLDNSKQNKSNYFPKDGCLISDPSPWSPHTIIPNLISSKTRVLDVGCNIGMLGKALKEKGNEVDGIDILATALEKAKPYYRHLYQRDLSRQRLNLPGNTTYDFVVFADILEHLPSPDKLLHDSKKYLKPTGKLIISLPNIARFELRLEHLFGKFEYKPGIMSFDHLRFFTRKSGKTLIEKCGFNVESMLPTGLGARIYIFPTLTAFQFIYVAKKRS